MDFSKLAEVGITGPTWCITAVIRNIYRVNTAEEEEIEKPSTNC
jgi:hypothetical protein